MKFSFAQDTPDDLGHVLRHLGHDVVLLPALSKLIGPVRRIRPKTHPVIEPRFHSR
jgi:hypothetical protein